MRSGGFYQHSTPRRLPQTLGEAGGVRLDNPQEKDHQADESARKRSPVGFFAALISITAVGSIWGVLVGGNIWLAAAVPTLVAVVLVIVSAPLKERLETDPEARAQLRPWIARLCLVIAIVFVYCGVSFGWQAYQQSSVIQGIFAMLALGLGFCQFMVGRALRRSA
jgi:hypothetical protein